VPSLAVEAPPRPAGVPASVDIQLTPHLPYPDPTMGVPLQRRGLAARAKNTVVTIGDSLTHGFQSGAIFNTSMSWPKIVAWELGCDSSFRFPSYDAFGGLPINLEYVLRDLEHHYGDSLGGIEYALAAFHVSHLLSQIEDYWERGPGSALPRRAEVMHNLAVYGWDLRDALAHNWSTLTAEVNAKKPKNDWLWKQIVEKANERAALRVYPQPGPNEQPKTVFQAAAALGAEGGINPDGSADPTMDGIETLVVALGANNCLGSVVSLAPVWSGPGFDDLNAKCRFNVWDPDHFKSEYRLVAKEIEGIRAQHVILANVPHVTIAPIARGVGAKIRPGSRYFPFYTRPWIRDEQFNEKDDPHITADMARALDSAVDQYNESIADSVRAARQQGLDWYLLDLCTLLDRLAARRYQDSPQARPPWWTPYELPPALNVLNPKPTSRFFASGPEGRTAGGLFSLDGIHPTTIAYGIFAQEVMNIMRLAGVPFYLSDGKTMRQGPVLVDFERLVRMDTLISSPPRSLTSDLRFIGWIDDKVDFFRGLFRSS
jgi:hypothetical protein